MSDSSWPHELQHARPPCPSPTPRVQSNSRPSSQWCHPATLKTIKMILIGAPITNFKMTVRADCAVSACSSLSLSITNSRSLPKLMSIETVMPYNYLILCHPLFLLPLIFPSIRVFPSISEVTLCIMWPKYWSFSFSISPSNEYSRLISFRIGWFDLHATQGILKSLLQHHS